MPASRVQLIGGAFQTSTGEVLENGTLRMYLNQDEQVVGAGNICSGVFITIQLDEHGNVSEEPAQLVWGNNQMLPVNSFYKVYGYTAKQQLAFGPNNQQVIGSGGTFDVGTWVPNVVISWVPPLQPLELQTNGVDNTSQSLLDFVDTATVTWVNSGGQMRATASGGASFSTPGQGYFAGAGSLPPFPFYGNHPASSVICGTPNQLTVYQFILPVTFTISRVSCNVGANVAAKHVVFGIYSAAGNKLIDSGAISAALSGVFGNSITPVTLPPGVYYFAQTSDSASVGVYCSDGVSAAMNNLLNGTQVHVGQAANPSVSNVLPATLGVITADILNLPIAVALFEV